MNRAATNSTACATYFSDLAALYGVETRALNQAVKRNRGRFSDDFMFDLSRDEILSISQFVISSPGLKFSNHSGETPLPLLIHNAARTARTAAASAATRAGNG
jgi:hypothetical protein